MHDGQKPRPLQLIAAAAACRSGEALREVAAHGEAAQLVPDEVGERGMTALLNVLEEAGERCCRTSTAAYGTINDRCS